MRRTIRHLTSVALVAFAWPAHGQDPTYTVEQLIGILKPAPAAATRSVGATRSLDPGTGPDAVPAAGTLGSGRLPDLPVLFEFNSAELTGDAAAQLDELGRALRSHELETFNFEVAGHTDAVGGEAYNQDLSARRAQAVAGYLEQNFGIPAERLAARGYGKSRLLDPGAPRSERNRRVEIVTAR